MNRTRKCLSPVFLFALTIVMLFGVAGSAYAQTQIGNLTAAPAQVAQGDAFEVTLNYNVSDTVNQLNGFGVRIYYDSALVAYESYTSLSTEATAFKIGVDPVPADDAGDVGGFGATGKFVEVVYLKLFQPGGFPGVALPVDLFKLAFRAQNTDGTAAIKIHESQLAAGYTFQGTDASVQIGSVVKTYTITPTAGANGTITPATAQTVNEGAGVEFTVAANSGYEVDAVTVDGVAATLTGGKYAFANVTADHTINVTFKQTPVCVAVAKITADKTSGVDPLAVSLDSAGSTAGVTYKWEITKGGSLVDSATTATYMYSFNAGTYTVKLTVTNTADGGCMGTDSVTITVSPSGEYKPGDADMDGMVDIFDALKVAMYVAGMVNITDADLLVALDVDQNGMVDINDALAIAKFDVGLDCGCVLNR